MNFACPTCQRRYTVPDEKVRGKSVKVKCKACGATITIEGPREVPPPAPPPPSLDDDMENRTVAFRSEDLLKLREQERELAQAPAAQAAAAKDLPIWFVMVGDQQVGPLDIASLRSKKVGGDLTVESFVWKDGMGEWKPARDVEELSLLFPREAEPPPPSISLEPVRAPEPTQPESDPPPPPNEDVAPSEPYPPEASEPTKAADDFTEPLQSDEAPRGGSATPSESQLGDLFDGGEASGVSPGAAPLVDVGDRPAPAASADSSATGMAYDTSTKKGSGLKAVVLLVLVLAVIAGAIFVLGVLGILPLGGLLGDSGDANIAPSRMAPVIAPAPRPIEPPPDEDPMMAADDAGTATVAGMDGGSATGGTRTDAGRTR